MVLSFHGASPPPQVGVLEPQSHPPRPSPPPSPRGQPAPQAGLPGQSLPVQTVLADHRPDEEQTTAPLRTGDPRQQRASPGGSGVHDGHIRHSGAGYTGTENTESGQNHRGAGEALHKEGPGAWQAKLRFGERTQPRGHGSPVSPRPALRPSPSLVSACLCHAAGAHSQRGRAREEGPQGAREVGGLPRASPAAGHAFLKRGLPALPTGGPGPAGAAVFPHQI